MFARNLGNSDSAAPREKGFVALCQKMVCKAVGNNQNFQQGESRGDQLILALIGLSENRLQQRKKLRMFFDEINKDAGVHADWATADVGPQSHDARSRST